jgi:carboxypeptidase Taq
MNKEPAVKELKARLKKVANLASVIAVLDWDQSVNMPTKATNARGESLSELSSIVHAKFLAINEDNLLTELKKLCDDKKIKGKDSIVVYETWRDYSRATKLPDEFIRERATLTTKAHEVWSEAREKNNFKLFLPYLTKIITLKQKEAEYIGYTETPYDALLDVYEPGMKTEEATKILNDLKDFLIPFLKKIKQSKVKISSKKTQGVFPIEKQVEFNKFIASKIGFDFNAGRLDISTHPFTTTFHTNDVRITTRYKKSDVLYSLGSTIHETGHGLYEQGLLEEHFGTALSEAISLGIHESQSRLWERIIGGGKPFWKYFYPRLQKEFPTPFKTLPFNEFYPILNEVKPSHIRTEADEVTYNLHIIIRFEIEKELLEGSLNPKDLPLVWSSKVKEYLGINVPTDTLGVLQDVHWAAGLFGYFPTYTFGNLYSAQFFSTMKKEIPTLAKDFEKGDFSKAKNWLRKNIHQHGKTYTASTLVKRVTGEELNSSHFTKYLEEKYKDIYKL